MHCAQARRNRQALLADIEKRGLINPLIVLNHRDPSKWGGRWVMTGNNRLWAARTLGWDTVPAIVTGECEFSCTPVAWDDINDYFPDGEIYLGSQGPRIKGYSDFVKGQFPL